eukprot:scaffold697_cov142-Alexandrium_tamarense.AAC.5
MILYSPTNRNISTPARNRRYSRARPSETTSCHCQLRTRCRHAPSLFSPHTRQIDVKLQVFTNTYTWGYFNVCLSWAGSNVGGVWVTDWHGVVRASFEDRCLRRSQTVVK